MSRISTPARHLIFASLSVLAGSVLLLAACGGGGGGGGGGGSSNNVPRFAYVANQGDNTVSQYTLNATTGQLRHNGYVIAGTAPASVAVNPAGTLAYVANLGSSSVSAYTIKPNGTLTPIICVGGAVCSGSNFATGINPISVTVDPTGKFAYVANNFNGVGGNSVSAYTIDTATGATFGFLTPVANSPFATGTSPQSVTINPAGTYAYVANSGTNNVSAFAINAASGVLSPVAGGPVTAGTNPNSVTINPAGTFAYVANGGGNVSAFAINAASGVLSPVAGVPVTAGTNPKSVTINPAGTFAYVANGGSNDVSAYTITATGALTQINCTGGAPAGCNANNFAAGTSPVSVTVDPSGKFAYVANSFDGVNGNSVSAYSIGATGALTKLPTVTGRKGPAAMAMTKGTAAVSYTPRFAYVANETANNVSVYTINAGTGALTAGTAVAAGIFPTSVTVDPSGKFAYVANSGSDNVSVYTIDAGTGALTPVTNSPFTAGDQPNSVTVDPSGKFAYVANYVFNNVSVYTIDAGTGALTAGTAVAAVSNPISVITTGTIQ